MAARSRAKVTSALAPMQMALLTAITHSGNQTARDGTAALAGPEPIPHCFTYFAYVRTGRGKGGSVRLTVKMTHFHIFQT